MINQYGDLNRMICDNKEAKRYFDSLPEYVKDSIRKRAQDVNTFEDLRNFAQNLTRDDE